MIKDVEQLLNDITDQPCSRAENPHGSILSLDFGVLSRRQDDEPGAKKHGFRHLTVLSPWRIQSPGEVICDWNTTGGAKGGITPAVAELVGCRVVKASCWLPAWDMRLKFDNSWELVVFGDSDDDREDAWFILGTDGAEGGAVPRIRKS